MVAINGVELRLAPGAQIKKCQMNEYDSAKMADVLRAAEGYEPHRTTRSRPT